jgi:hypothetical protein
MKMITLGALICIGFLSVPAFADEPAAEEWVDIPVVVNIIDASDASKVDDAVKKANEILAQAHIRLVVKKTNKDVKVGNNDGNLTEKEGDTARKDGQKELDKTFKDKDGKWTGKGIKVTVADDSWVEDPNNIGWSNHQSPVVVVESGSADQMGSTLAHELIHALTVPEHSDDPNNVMYPTDEGGTKIDKKQIDEIFPEAKKRGDDYSKRPSLIPGTYSLAPSGVEYHLNGFGAMLDPIEDVICIGGTCEFFNPSDPSLACADLQEVSLFADDPATPGTMAQLDIDFGGLIPPPPAIVNMIVLAEFDSNSSIPGPESRLTIIGSGPDTQAWQAILQPINPPGPPRTLPVLLHLNERFDGPAPIPHHHSLEVLIPLEFVPIHLTSVDPILVTVNARTTISPNPLVQLQLQDPPNSFSYHLSQREWEDITLNFLPHGLAGRGFHPNSNVEIRVNDLAVGLVTTNTNGIFEFDGLPLNPPPGEYSVLAIEQDTGLFTPAHSIGFFHIPPPTTLRADIDGDGCVSILDLAIVSGEWMRGCNNPSM